MGWPGEFFLWRLHFVFVVENTPSDVAGKRPNLPNIKRRKAGHLSFFTPLITKGATFHRADVRSGQYARLLSVHHFRYSFWTSPTNNAGPFELDTQHSVNQSLNESTNSWIMPYGNVLTAVRAFLCLFFFFFFFLTSAGTEAAALLLGATFFLFLFITAASFARLFFFASRKSRSVGPGRLNWVPDRVDIVFKLLFACFDSRIDNSTKRMFFVQGFATEFSWRPDR